ncbi:MAG: chromosomal replication initiator protein DnaA [Ktedonobacterales bacterium]
MTMDAKQVWTTGVEKLRLRISPAAFALWCLGSHAESLVGNQLIVSIPAPLASGAARHRFQEQVRIAISEVLGQRAEVIFVPRSPESEAALAPIHAARAQAELRSHLSPFGHTSHTAVPLGAPYRQDPCQSSQSSQLSQSRAFPPAHRHPAPATGRLPVVLQSRREIDHRSPEAYSLHPRYAFETFVIGRANQLAFAAAREVASHPGEQYNPLLIYGGPGLGKTHLLQAIGHYTKQSGLAVAYVTAERFANEIIEAIHQRSTDQFRARYRAADVLLVDDIQFIAGKVSTEEEFFHTFNALHDASKQIVLTSDRVPQAMCHLHDRLRSRFQWGLIADIDAPSFEHRLSILRAKAAALPVAIPEEVLVCLARPDCESIRALEGSLNRVVASAQILGRPLDTRLAAWTLAPLAAEPVDRAPEDVIAAVARYFGLAVAALEGASRERAVAWARQVAMYLLREETSASLFRIGQQLGGRDHTTVLHGCHRVGQALVRDDLARADISAIRATLRR